MEVFSPSSLIQEEIRNNLMKICLLVHSIYGAGGVVLLGVMGVTKFL
ncbi:hypothetical protein [Blautia pseudococcoides]|nr:hypothetical protein [Blautia pseudococcoides]MCR2018344.1 hypothetical protein [Blautia pseudococcoides]QJU15591.1 hypothetical protein HL650_14770 [Blautia pseudococcoides]QQQ91897.1 hypothetical protein I5Q86_16450 [Blautia pseudococcoides]